MVRGFLVAMIFILSNGFPRSFMCAGRRPPFWNRATCALYRIGSRSLSLSLSLSRPDNNFVKSRWTRPVGWSLECVRRLENKWLAINQKKKIRNKSKSTTPAPPLCPHKKVEGSRKKPLNPDRLVTDRLPSFSLFCCPFFQKKMVKASQKWLQYLATLHAPIFPFFFVRFNGHFLSFFTTRIS